MCIRDRETKEKSKGPKKPAGLDPVSVSLQADLEVGHRRTGRRADAVVPAAGASGASDDAADATAVVPSAAATPASEPDDDDDINPS